MNKIWETDLKDFFYLFIWLSILLYIQERHTASLLSIGYQIFGMQVIGKEN